MHFDVTNQEFQEQRIVNSFNHFNVISDPRNKRLIAALTYFHRARRLARSGSSPWEFMSEIIVNYSKVLEVLFPGPESIKAARSGLATINYTETEIENIFIPVIALRNKIDGAHVDLTIFSKATRNNLFIY